MLAKILKRYHSRNGINEIVEATDGDKTKATAADKKSSTSTSSNDANKIDAEKLQPQYRYQVIAWPKCV